jgi:hypothetical protein
MKRSVKTLVLSTIATLFLALTHGQLKIAPVNGGVGADVKKVIDDYPNRFANLMGEMIQENTQSTEYRCNFSAQGAEETSITRYSSQGNNVYSWQALMLSTESFEKAKQKFRTLFNQLNNLSVRPVGGASYHLKGNYEMPREEMKFTSVVFSMSPENDAVKKIKTEVTLQYELTEWKVKVIVYDREREDEERGKRVEE